MSGRLGILGGGQLALYLCQAAKTLGVEVAVASHTDEAPALDYAAHALVGSLEDEQTLTRFLAHSDVVTFDREDIPAATLDRLAQAEQRGEIRVRPHVETLRMLQDKGLQKTWLEQQGLPTLAFELLDGRPDTIAGLTERFGTALVQKARRGGFDGRGVQILPQATAEQLWDGPTLIEPLLADNRELAVIAVRSCAGDVQVFPPVSMHFAPQLNSLTTVAMPAAVTPQQRDAAIELAERVVTGLEGIGSFAIELFVTPDDELLINEISPRVHNSGHLTMDACNVSQFEQHVRAVMGMALIDSDMLSPGAMRNILYEQAMYDRCPPQPSVEHLPASGATAYWYGKQPGSPGRKMGHINALAATASAALEQANQGFADIVGDNREQAG